MIPRKIHYCWFGPKLLPEIVVTCMKTWNDKLSGYEMYLWNENNSPMHLPFVKQAYEARKYAFVSDYIRFWALYEHGGIYLDTDMIVIRTFDDLLDCNAFFAWETASKKSVGCCVIGASPKQPFIGNIMNRYTDLHFKIESIPDLVIPHIVSKCFNDYLSKEEVTIFPYDYFYPFPYEEKENVCSYMQYITKNTYAIHLWNISWGTFKDKLRDWLLYHFRKTWRRAI
jgi:mannosyltransferase OCH1-like enzyme